MEPSTAAAQVQPLLPEAGARGAMGSGKALPLLTLLAGVGVGVLVGQVSIAANTAQEPSTVMAASYMQPSRTRYAPQAASAVRFPSLQWLGLKSAQTASASVAWQSPRQSTGFMNPFPLTSSSDFSAPSFVPSAGAGWDSGPVTDMNAAAKVARLKHLEEQAAESLKLAVASGKKVVFPNALIAGDAVITYLLHKYDLLKDVEVLAVDTLHLFPETLEFLKDVETAYNFKAHISMAEGITGYGAEAKAMYDKKYGADLWKTNIEEYDRLCKVEPFQRGLKTLGAEVIITGRTRWQGNERAWLDIYEAPRKPGGLGNCNPIAFWTLEDTFDFIAMNKILHHPLHAKGYPSIGDAKDTIPIPEDGSVYFKDGQFTGDKTEWLGYALERKGRFVGLANKDGSTKTECGIHVSGAEKTWDRDLWDKSTTVTDVQTEDELMKIKELTGTVTGGSLVVVYAPWCQFCQAMEGSFEEVSKEADMSSFNFVKFRGDTRRDFVQSNLETQSFPTIGFMKNGKFVKYASEDRSVAALRKFVKESDESIALNEA